MYNCTCKLPVPFDIKKIDYTCQAPYDLIETGLTKGIFQMDSYLGRQWGPKLKPRSLEEISDLIAIVRPGCLETGISERYAKYKFNGETPEYLHKDLVPILSSTYGQMVYQEQMMKICWSIAGLDLEIADNIRKACGKKNLELMKEKEDIFIKGCLDNKYDIDMNKKMWSEIQQSAEYSFNKSHSIAYARTTYRTAFLKAHFPTLFFKSLLNVAQFDSKKLEEVAEIASDCWRFGITIQPLGLDDLRARFHVVDKDIIHFGIQDVKGMSTTKSKRIETFEKGDTFSQCYLGLMRKAGKGAFQSLIKCGIFDSFTKNRECLSNRADSLFKLTAKELTIMNESIEKGATITDSLKILLSETKKNNRTKRRAPKVEAVMRQVNEASKIKTPKHKIAMYEKTLLGTVLSETGKSFYRNNAGSHKCSEIMHEEQDIKGSVFATIDTVRPYTTKRGKQMAYITISDDTGMYEGAMIFSNKYYDWASILYEGATRTFEFLSLKNGISITNVR